MSNRSCSDGSGGVAEREHLSDVEDGAGCTGIWEYLSERRSADD